MRDRLPRNKVHVPLLTIILYLITISFRFDVWRNGTLPFPALTAAEVMSAADDPEYVATKDVLMNREPDAPALPWTPETPWQVKSSTFGRFFSSRQRIRTTLGIPFYWVASHLKSRQQ